MSDHVEAFFLSSEVKNKMATLVTFDVDATLILKYLPQINIQNDAPVTTVSEIIENCSAEVCAVFVSTYGDYLSDVSSDDTSVTYKAIQRAIIILAKPEIYVAAFLEGDGGLLSQLREDAENLRERMRKDPKGVFGYIVASSGAPSSFTSSTKAMGLEQDDVSLADRRNYDSRNRTGKDARFYW